MPIPPYGLYFKGCLNFIFIKPIDSTILYKYHIRQVIWIKQLFDS